ncbi:hypothetical protein FSP39_014640 [Pinctada imbricata]|uniref:B box-type domain-containing protein n=1 Tax=Pinctada imbricata TaxID=66713 RepID=A0AA88XD85_PINIB|nr:hypothetical protein FSP39_014640 [Pinctada imbricata]
MATVGVNNNHRPRVYVKCEGCKKEAEFYCNTCGSKYCQTCKVGHLRSRISKDHKIIPFSEKIGEMAINYRARLAGCLVHPGTPFERCCKQCLVPVCAECIMGEHATHPIAKISSVYETQRDLLVAEADEIKERIIPNIEYFLGTVTGGAARLRAEVQKIRLELRNFADKLKDAVTKVLDENLQFIDEMADDDFGKLKDREGMLFEILKQLKKIVGTYDEIVESGDAVSLLMYMKNDKPDFDNIRRIPEIKIPAIPEYRQGNVDVHSLQHQFGKIGKPNTFDSLASKGGGMRQLVKPKVLMDLPVVDFDFDSLASGQLLGLRTLGSEATCIRHHGSNLKLTDTKGRVLETYRTGLKKHPNDMLMESDTQLLFADGENNAVKLITKGKMPTTLIKTGDWTPEGLCKFGEDLLVSLNNSASRTSKVTKFNRICKPLQDIQFDNQGKPLYKKATFMAVNSKNRDICTIDMAAARVVVVDHYGKWRFDYVGANDSSYPFRPRDICSDSIGLILIADEGSYAIHVINDRGQFLRHLLTKQSGLRHPFTLSIDQKERLWIGEHTTKKVKVVTYLQ